MDVETLTREARGLAKAFTISCKEEGVPDENYEFAVFIMYMSLKSQDPSKFNEMERIWLTEQKALT